MAQGGGVEDRVDDPNDDVYWRIFDEFFNQTVVIIKDNDKLFNEVLEKAISELLHSEMEKEKLPRLFKKNPVIGCKAFMRCIRAFLRKAKDPKGAFGKVLSIFENCDCGGLKEIAGKMKGKVSTC